VRSDPCPVHLRTPQGDRLDVDRGEQPPFPLRPDVDTPGRRVLGGRHRFDGPQLLERLVPRAEGDLPGPWVLPRVCVDCGLLLAPPWFVDALESVGAGVTLPVSTADGGLPFP